MNNKPIGIFDSGVGGTAVLRTIQNLLPEEKYLLFADFENAPYGEKSKDEILRLSRHGVELLAKKGAKAVVIACNTATSAAIEELRDEYDIPIIGMEPAVKPAAESVEEGKIVVLATSATLKFMKFQKLTDSLGGKNIIPVECPGLSRLIETVKPGSPEIIKYLEDVLSEHTVSKIDVAVIGCTHYSFVEKDIAKVTGCDKIFDGRHGTARHLKHTLEENGLLGENRLETEYILKGTGDEYVNMLLDFMSRPLSL